MKKLSLQWRLTIITTLFIALICGCLTMFIYQNGVYYMDDLQNTVEGSTDKNSNNLYISIPDDVWDDFADNFSIQVNNNKTDYRNKSLLISSILSLLGGVITYFISGRALKPLSDFSNKIEEVQAQNLSDSRIEENKVKELNQLSVSYNKMLDRLSAAFEVQRQFTANAAHELRTPLALMQVQLDAYNSTEHPDNDASATQTIQMVTEQNERLTKMVKTLLDMSELQTIARDETIDLDALIEEVLVDLEPLAQEKNITLTNQCNEVKLLGSDILIYRLVYNLVENGIKYNRPGGMLTVRLIQEADDAVLTVEDTGLGIPEEACARIFDRFYRVDKSRSRSTGGSGLGLSIVHSLVISNGGTIQVTSKVNVGTQFTLRFPLFDTEASI